MVKKTESNRIDKKGEIAEEKNLKKRVVIIGIILLIFLLLSLSLFFGRYFFIKNKIKNIFNSVSEKDSEIEFNSGSFASLTDACLGKEIGDDCNYEFKGENKKGICSLSGENRSVCVSAG